jgi:HSP20 family molecular chaperone IbpA
MEDMAMRDFDLTPVRRSTIGFDRLFDLIDDSFRLQGEDNYPPYNIARVGEVTIASRSLWPASSRRRSPLRQSRTC